MFVTSRDVFAVIPFYCSVYRGHPPSNRFPDHIDGNFSPGCSNIIGSTEFTVIWKLGTIMITLVQQIKVARPPRARDDPLVHSFLHSFVHFARLCLMFRRGNVYRVVCTVTSCEKLTTFIASVRTLRREENICVLRDDYWIVRFFRGDKLFAHLARLNGILLRHGWERTGGYSRDIRGSIFEKERERERLALDARKLFIVNNSTRKQRKITAMNSVTFRDFNIQ